MRVTDPVHSHVVGATGDSGRGTGDDDDLLTDDCTIVAEKDIVDLAKQFVGVSLTLDDR